MKAVLAAAVAALCALAQPLHAQAPAYPSKVVRMVVPFPPGGGFDGIARPYAEKLSAILGQPVVLDYRPGAGGNIGVEHAAKSTPDGHTLLVANVSMTTSPAMWKTIGYDAVNDFAPISRIGVVSSAFAINPALPAKDLKELAALSKVKPLNFASPGVGTSSHLIGEMMNIEGILSLVHIPYKGTAPAVADALGGQLDAVMVPLVSLAPHIKSGKLRGIAVSSAVRVPMPPMNGNGIKNPNRARLGMVCARLARPTIGRASKGRRAATMPSGMPMAAAMAVEAATSTTCSPNRVAISARWDVMNASNSVMWRPPLGRPLPSARARVDPHSP